MKSRHSAASTNAENQQSLNEFKICLSKVDPAIIYANSTITDL